ncbi:MAG: RNA methyltransferase, partial [Bacteroidales bacterium]|nr:RNA methyltransferase [Bacteroidales bacterium]
MMISKNEIKEIRALGQKKFREERGLFVVEGEKLVEEALRSGFDVVAHYRVEDIGEETMGRISQLTHPSPALAVVRRPAPVDPVIDPDELVLALDGVRDPGNLGTILRIADWFGIRQVLASPDTVE